MKILILILSFILSVFSDGKVAIAGENEKHFASGVEAARQNKPDNNPSCYSQAILPVQSARFSGESSGVAPMVRFTAGRRTQVSQKFPFRIIKAGKIIDKSHFFIFQEELHQFQSGIRSTSRYIHSICHLLI